MTIFPMLYNISLYIFAHSNLYHLSPIPIPPFLTTLSLLVSPSLFLHLWVCFFFVIVTSLLYFLDSICKWYHTVFVFLCLTYFTLHMLSRFIHVLQVAKFHYFLWISSISLCIYATSSFSIHLLIDHNFKLIENTYIFNNY